MVENRAEEFSCLQRVKLMVHEDFTLTDPVQELMICQSTRRLQCPIFLWAPNAGSDKSSSIGSLSGVICGERGQTKFLHSSSLTPMTRSFHMFAGQDDKSWCSLGASNFLDRELWPLTLSREGSILLLILAKGLVAKKCGSCDVWTLRVFVSKLSAGPRRPALSTTIVAVNTLGLSADLVFGKLNVTCGLLTRIRVSKGQHLLGSMVQQLPCRTGGHWFNSHGWLPHLMWTLLEYSCSIWPWWEIAVDDFGNKVVGVAVYHILWELKPLDGRPWIEIGVLCTKSINLCLCFMYLCYVMLATISLSNNWQKRKSSCQCEEQPHSPLFWESRWNLGLLLHAECVRSSSTLSSQKNLLRVTGVTHRSMLLTTAWNSTHLCRTQIACVPFTTALGAIRCRISTCKSWVRTHRLVCIGALFGPVD